MSDKVMGNCPMGCGDTLFLGSGGYVTCSWRECPDPSAVADLLLLPSIELQDRAVLRWLIQRAGEEARRG